MEVDQKTRRERFEEARKARERAEKARKNANFKGNTPIPDYEYLVLKPNKCQVFRMLGSALEMRKETTDPILVERGIIQADDKSWFNMIYHPDTNHPFRILMRKLGKYTFDTKTKNKTYANEGCELLNRMRTNGKSNPSTFETGWLGKKYVLANVIDRMDMDYHKKTGKTKVFAWDVSEKDGKEYPQPGITIGFYKYLFDTVCCQYSTHFNDSDFVVRRFTSTTRPNDQTNYLIMHPEEKTPISLWNEKDGIDYYSFIKQTSYLDDEDEKLVKFPLENIPFISMPTPVSVIMNKLGSFIKDFDRKYKMNIWEQMVEWKEKEIEELKSKNENVNEEANMNESYTEKDEKELPTEIEEKLPITKKVSKVITKTKEFDYTSLSDEIYEIWPGLSKFENKEWQLIKNIDVENQEIDWNKDVDAECSQCGYEMPEELNICPNCGTDFS